MASDEDLRNSHQKFNRKRHKRHAGGGWRIAPPYLRALAERGAEIASAKAALLALHRERALGVWPR